MGALEGRTTAPFGLFELKKLCHQFVGLDEGFHCRERHCQPSCITRRILLPQLQLKLKGERGEASKTATDIQMFAEMFFYFDGVGDNADNRRRSVIGAAPLPLAPIYPASIKHFCSSSSLATRASAFLERALPCTLPSVDTRLPWPVDGGDVLPCFSATCRKYPSTLEPEIATLMQQTDEGINRFDVHSESQVWGSTVGHCCVIQHALLTSLEPSADMADRL